MCCCSPRETSTSPEGEKSINIRRTRSSTVAILFIVAEIQKRKGLSVCRTPRTSQTIKSKDRLFIVDDTVFCHECEYMKVDVSLARILVRGGEWKEPPQVSVRIWHAHPRATVQVPTYTLHTLCVAGELRRALRPHSSMGGRETRKCTNNQISAAVYAENNESLSTTVVHIFRIRILLHERQMRKNKKTTPNC